LIHYIRNKIKLILEEVENEADYIKHNLVYVGLYNTVEQIIDRRLHALFRFSPLYWFRSTIINKYHIIDIRNTGDYKWGYVDVSNKIWLASFKLLVEYVEDEKCFDHIDWTHEPMVAKEIFELYIWWKIGRDLEWNKLREMYPRKSRSLEFEVTPETKGLPKKDRLYTFKQDVDNETILKYTERLGELEEKDTEQLVRLVKIRSHLWT
jgi:hypothetical protein